MALYKEVVAADPDGRMGTMEHLKKTVSCTEYAEFMIAQNTSYGRGSARSIEPVKAFLRKYPSSPLRKAAYSALASHYMSPRTDKDDSQRFFEEAVAQYPDDPWFRYYYAMRVTQTKDDVDKAIEVAEGMASFNPATAANARAQLYALKGDLSRAEASYGPEFADGQVAGLASALSQYASFWIQQKQHLESAEKALQTAVRLAPENPYYRQTAANFHLQEGKADKALSLFGPEFVKTVGTNASALTAYARFWVQKKQNTESAAEALEAAMKLNPAEYYTIQTAADAFFLMDKADRALAIYGPAYIQGRQDEPLVLAGYARFWAGKKTNLESALTAAEQAVKLPAETSSFNLAYIWDTLATVYLAAGRPEDALKAEEKAIELDTAGYNLEFYKANLKKIQAEIDKKKK